MTKSDAQTVLLPGDIEKAYEILKRLCSERVLGMSIPVQQSDEDMVFVRVIKAAQRLVDAEPVSVKDCHKAAHGNLRLLMKSGYMEPFDDLMNTASECITRAILNAAGVKYVD
jgi:hypothetical protein